ncbi:STAS domain-containing protein [Mycolicibacterium phlei]
MTVAAIPEPPPQPRQRLTVTPLAHAGEVTVAVRGDVDAANARDFASAVCALVDDALDSGGEVSRVTLDMVDLGFLAIDGVAALHAINAHVSHADVAWAVLPGEAVSRVLGLCDPESVIPLASRPAVGRGRGGLRLVQPL